MGKDTVEKLVDIENENVDNGTLPFNTVLDEIFLSLRLFSYVW